VLSCLAEDKMSLAQLVVTLPKYYIIKSKAALPDNFSARLGRFEKKESRLFGRTAVDKRDGLRFDFQQGWVQIRPSNTEPIFRLIVETSEQKLTRRLSQEVMEYFT